MKPQDVYCLECVAGTEREFKAFEARVAELEFEAKQAQVELDHLTGVGMAAAWYLQDTSDAYRLEALRAALDGEEDKP